MHDTSTHPGPWRSTGHLLAGITLLCGAALSSLVMAAGAGVAAADAHFAAGDYAAAIDGYERALGTAPGDAALHLRLGRAYGRAAERASWVRAVDLAGKARDSFEEAVRLAPDNTDALLTLMKFYASAPAILGGGMDKALAIAERLDELDPEVARDARHWLQTRDRSNG